VYTHHNSKYPVPRPLFYGVVNRSADAFVSVCGQTQADATQSFKGPSQVIHNGIDRIQYAECDPQRAPNFPIRLVSIGSLTEQKNHRRALQMMQILGPSYHLTIYGEGPQRQALQELAGDLGLTNVTFKGVSSELAQELWKYDLMVQASSWEGMPLSLLEGQAAGLPVVATDVGDTSIIVDDGVTGHLVFPRTESRACG
jgi:glycosyltransferase involved in cell wall biosynthesis